MLPGTNHSRIIARSGFDWVLVDTEHGNIDGELEDIPVSEHHLIKPQMGQCMRLLLLSPLVGSVLLSELQLMRAGWSSVGNHQFSQKLHGLHITGALDAGGQLFRGANRQIPRRTNRVQHMA